MVDLVPSDVLASFLLAAAMQRADRSAALKTVLTGDDSAEKAREAERETADITASLFLLLHFINYGSLERIVIKNDIFSVLSD